MNNLPDGVSETTSEAPWNEMTYPLDITAILTLTTEVPFGTDVDVIRAEAIDELRRALIDTDFEIEDVVVEF